MALSKSFYLEHAQSAVLCNVCENEIPGEFYCLECKQTLCPQCEGNHRKVAATKNHNIVLRSQVGDIDTATLTCCDHGEQATFRCKKCNIPVCMRCITGTHRGHKMDELNEKLEREKKLLRDDINKIKNDVLPKLKKKKEEIRKHKEKYEKKIKQISKDMEDEHQARHADLTRIHNGRMKNLHTFRDENVAMFDGYSKEIISEMNSCEERISKSEDALRKNNMTSIEILTQVKLPLSGEKSTIRLPDPPFFVPVNVHTIDNILGKLNPKVKLTTSTIVLQFRCPLQGSSRICITNEGDIWLGGSESRELVMVDIKGQVLRRRKIQNRPAALAVMECGDVIISPQIFDSNSVSRLLKDGREQHVYDASPSWSCGVSVTADQNILICTGDGRVVRVNGDGTHVEQIYKCSVNLSTIYAVENANGNIYISNMTHHAVVIASKDGEVLSTINCTTGGQLLGSPWGLVVDKMDNIFCADSNNNCVYIIDQDHQMRELVGPSHGIQHPLWLAVDDAYNLWITQRDGTVHVVRYFSA